MSGYHSHSRKSIQKFIIIGNSNCGKTSLISQFAHKKVDKSYKATIGSDFVSVKKPIDNQICTLQIWDTAGQERFQSLGPAFYRGADACLLVFDLTDPESFKKLDRWKKDFSKHGNVNDADNFPFVVVGNKSDLENERKVDRSRAMEWCKVNGGSKPLPYYETSALQDKGVDDCFLEAARLALAQSESNPPDNFMPETINLNTQPVKQSQSSCC